ncbi:hypothetical protein EJB05_31526, partial [Eragrostis curvula]
MADGDHPLLERVEVLDAELLQLVEALDAVRRRHKEDVHEVLAILIFQNNYLDFFSLKRKLYTCRGIYSAGCGTFFSDAKGAACPSCGGGMTTVTRYVPPGWQAPRGLAPAAGARRGEGGGESADGGFVRSGATTYVVKDDLTILPTPASAVSSVELLTGALDTHSVGRKAELQVQNVTFGRAESKEILKASLHSKTVLTDVFLRRMQV